MARRGNGLQAQAYTPLAELEPETTDAILDALGAAGVAAYAAPAAADATALLGGRQTDRLYVDSAARGRAEAVLMDRLPALHDAGDDAPPAEAAQPPDEDAAWHEIIAGFEADRRDDPTWPDRENLEDPGQRLTAARVIRPAEPTQAGQEPDVEVDGTDEPPAEDEGHYVPPPPPPLPQADAATKFSWLALAGGPAYLLVTALMSWEVPGWAAFIAVAAFVGGFVSLVMRMGDGHRDGPDDGAVI